MSWISDDTDNLMLIAITMQRSLGLDFYGACEVWGRVDKEKFLSRFNRLLQHRLMKYCTHSSIVANM